MIQKKIKSALEEQKIILKAEDGKDLEDEEQERLQSIGINDTSKIENMEVIDLCLICR